MCNVLLFLAHCVCKYDIQVLSLIAFYCHLVFKVFWLFAELFAHEVPQNAGFAYTTISSNTHF